MSLHDSEYDLRGLVGTRRYSRIARGTDVIRGFAALEDQHRPRVAHHEDPNLLIRSLPADARSAAHAFFGSR